MATLIGVVASSKKGNQTINAYFGTGPDEFCAGSTLATTVYNSTYSTIANAYTNNSPIYSDSGLSFLADDGVYGDTSGGAGQTNYPWSATGGWSDSSVC